MSSGELLKQQFQGSTTSKKGVTHEPELLAHFQKSCDPSSTNIISKKKQPNVRLNESNNTVLPENDLNNNHLLADQSICFTESKNSFDYKKRIYAIINMFNPQSLIEHHLSVSEILKERLKVGKDSHEDKQFTKKKENSIVPFQCNNNVINENKKDQPETKGRTVGERYEGKDYLFERNLNAGRPDIIRHKSLSNIQNGMIPENLEGGLGKGILNPFCDNIQGKLVSSYDWQIPDPGSQKLSWNKPPLTVLVVRKLYDADIIYPFKELVRWLIEVKNMVVYADSQAIDCSNEDDEDFVKIKQKLIVFNEVEVDLTSKIDFLICLGGDGTLIHCSSFFQQSVPPVMAFNMGSLGFLTPFQFCNFKEEINRVLEGNASLLLRYRLKCIICDENSDCSQLPHVKCLDKSSEVKRSLKTHLVLNEIVVDRGSSPYLCNVDLYIEGRLVTSVQGDGLIISTPTGSTAYAVAAGASMIHPNVPCILITPICPHSLSFRPIVVPAGVEIKLMLSPEARSAAWVSFDGRNRKEIKQGDSVRITTATYPIPSICAKDHMNDWFDGLADCLHWNVRKQQKALPSMSSTASLTSLLSDSEIMN